jgi:hypothetical protein
MASQSPRQRRGFRYVNRVSANFGWVNQYPWMASAEAMVHRELERRHIPFSWRYFDGESPWLQELMPDYAPEFTLREHKLVIIVVGAYFGTLPGVIDRTALAQAALEQDGWKVVSLFADDIENKGANVVLTEKAPELSSPVAFGEQRESPYERPTYFQELRERLAALSLRRSRFALEEEQRPKERTEDGRTTRRRTRRRPARPRNARRRRRR